MSDEPNDGETAFPATTPGGYCTPGMTLRDWFAGQALAGLQFMNTSQTYGKDAELCYRMADAMLKTRDAEPDTTTAQQIALGIGGVK
tara:strand:- start:870 stop:1130 length:261 start_codon:yes stop_codon:yes gene_type:complete